MEVTSSDTTTSRVPIRLYLAYSSQVWRPHLQIDNDSIGSVRRLEKKSDKTNFFISYDEKTNILNLTRLETTRVCGNLMGVIMIFDGMENQDTGMLFIYIYIEIE